MASFLGNFTFKTAMKLHTGIFLFLWIKRNSGLSWDRDYSSSLPVRYIPKKSSKGDETKGAHVEKMEELNGLKTSKSRFNTFDSSGSCLNIEYKNHAPLLTSNINYGVNLDVEEEIEDDFIAETDGSMEEPDEVVKSNNKRGKGFQVGKNQQDVEKSAIELLATRAFTAVELKKKLLGKKFSLEIVDSVVDNFQHRGLINDLLYAETFSRSRWSSSSWGPRRIKQALFKKGVSEVDADNVIRLVFENGEANEDQYSGIAMSKLSIDQLYVQASKQWLRSQAAPLETRKSRLIRWLQYRGFNWSVIKYVLKKLESE